MIPDLNAPKAEWTEWLNHNGLATDVWPYDQIVQKAGLTAEVRALTDADRRNEGGSPVTPFLVVYGAGEGFLHVLRCLPMTAATPYAPAARVVYGCPACRVAGQADHKSSCPTLAGLCLHEAAPGQPIVRQAPDGSLKTALAGPSVRCRRESNHQDSHSDGRLFWNGDQSVPTVIALSRTQTLNDLAAASTP